MTHPGDWRFRVAFAALAASALAACGSYGSSEGPNPNMQALNARYGIEPGNKNSEEVPLFLYYPDAKRPPPPESAMPAQPAPVAVASSNAAHSSGA